MRLRQALFTVGVCNPLSATQEKSVININHCSCSWRAESQQPPLNTPVHHPLLSHSCLCLPFTSLTLMRQWVEHGVFTSSQEPDSSIWGSTPRDTLKGKFKGNSNSRTKTYFCWNSNMLVVKSKTPIQFTFYCDINDSTLCFWCRVHDIEALKIYFQQILPFKNKTKQKNNFILYFNCVCAEEAGRQPYYILLYFIFYIYYSKNKTDYPHCRQNQWYGWVTMAMITFSCNDTIFLEGTMEAGKWVIVQITIVRASLAFIPKLSHNKMSGSLWIGQ